MEKLTPLYDPAKGPMKVMALMSGSGTNVRRVLEHQEALKQSQGASPFEIIGLFSDNLSSNAPEIAREYDLTVMIRDIRAFYQTRGIDRLDLSKRYLFDEECIRIIGAFNPDILLFGGYMSIITPLMTEAFLAVNVHPGDLRVMKDGKRSWTGMHPVRDCLVKGEREVRATTHLVEPTVDGGRLLLLSEALKLEIPQGRDLSNKADLKELEAFNQERLKKQGDWKIMPLCFEFLARGYFAADPRGNLYFRGKAIPEGVLMEELKAYLA
ncbi:MAG: hypothetical protein JXR70_11995 [Spirochaetales bacterium]|nr:hypothetical protein [Spirochaetales bacterium]